MIAVPSNGPCADAVGHRGPATVRHGASPHRLAATGAAPALLLAAAAVAGALALAAPAARTHAGGRPRAHLAAAGSLAQAASASIGAFDRSFWAVRKGGSLHASGGRLRSAFTASGVAVHAPGGTLRLSAAALGRGASVRPLPARAPLAVRNRVLYRRGAVQEYYRNGPYGLEQGFILRRRPLGGGAPVALVIGLGGSLRARQAGSEIVFGRPGGRAELRYGQLSAYDATGRPLKARARLRGGAVWLQIDDAGARYPVQVDPYVHFGKKLVDGESSAGLFGFAVTLSGDGTTALIGSPDARERAGAAWVFVRTGKGWEMQGERLAPAGEVGVGLFGFSVALSSDGNTALIGGTNDNSNLGAAWVFTRTGEKWSQQGGKLTGGSSEKGEAGFGFSVALSSDGSTALIGAPFDQVRAGAAWVFTRAGETWTQQGAKLTGANEKGAGVFGFSVALSSDGNTALVAAPEDNSEKGAAWPFARAGGSWSAQGEKLTGAEENGKGHFGESVALSSDGSTALAGAPGDSERVGAAWGFSRTGEKWSQQGTELRPAEGEEVGEGRLGESVALSADGNTALVGAPGDRSTNGGAAWAFARAGGAWSSQQKLTTGPDASGDTVRFGESVALSADASTALIGGRGDAGEVGAAWVFYAGPTSVTRAASELTQSSATLNGTVNPNGATVEGCAFEYGTSTAYTSSMPCSPSPSGSGSLPLKESAAITGLEPGTTYHFRIVAKNSGGTSNGADLTFTTVPVAPVVLTGEAKPVGQTGATLNGTVNPNGGELTSCKFEYGETIASKTKFVQCASTPKGGKGAVPVSAAVTGLITSRTYYFRLVAANAGGSGSGADRSLETLPPVPPSVEAKSASAETQTSATLHASVNPNGGEVTSCKFEYGPIAKPQEKSKPCESLPGSGTEGVAVSASVRGLSPTTIYHFNITATNSAGTTTGGKEGEFKTLAPEGPLALTGEASPIGKTSATLNATVNPHGSEVTECAFEYGTEGKYTKSVPCSSPGAGAEGLPVSVSATVTELAPNTTYHYRIVAKNLLNKSEGKDQTFTTLPNAPAVVTSAAEAIKQTEAVLHASVNPNGGEVTSCKFEYGASGGPYVTSAECEPSPGNGAKAVLVSAPVQGLWPNTSYHFRVIATNSGGTEYGADQPFLTLPEPPVVKTEAASELAPSSATLTGSANPNGVKASECKFEYGPSTSYGTSAPCSSLPEGGSPQTVSAAISGLVASSIYHYRVVAANAGSGGKPSMGEDRTLPAVPAVVTGKATEVHQASATLKATVNPNGGKITSCTLEYGSNGYEKNAPCAPAPGSGTTPEEVSASVTGLTVNEAYVFRVTATNARGQSKGAEQQFKTLPKPPSLTTGTASAVTQTTATLNAKVNPNGAAVTECKFEYSASGELAKSVPCEHVPEAGNLEVPVAAAVSALVPNTTYYFRIVAKNAGGQAKEAEEGSFTTLPYAPAVITGTATSVTQTTAQLAASVNPNGAQVSECKLEYGEPPEYTKAAPCSPSPGAGGSAVSVSAAISSLRPNTAYHFRVAAASAGGLSTGAEATLRTLAPAKPTAVTGAASSITNSSATLNATVNPNGGAVSECDFEYGASAAYGAAIDCAERPGGESIAVAVSASVSGLIPGTTYHFRIIALNPFGPLAEGADQTFTTASVPAPPSIGGGASGPSAPPHAPPAPPAVGGGTSAVGASLAATTLPVSISKSVVKVKLLCLAPAGSCTGMLKLQALAPTAGGSHGARKRSRGPMTLARSSFALGAGQTVTLKLRMSAAARALLSRARTMRASAVLASSEPAGAPTTQTPVRLRAGK